MENNNLLLNPFWINNNEVKQLFMIFGINNIKVVGGAVRNAIKKNTTRDLDFAVKLEQDEVKNILRKRKINFFDKSKGHGTVSLKNSFYNIEITSLREDMETDGRKAKVSYTDSFLLDAKRRDFTINAIYSSLNGDLFDPFNGIEDLKNNKIKFIGNPLQRIKEDKLRLLRYFRMLSLYTSKLKEIDKKSLKASTENFYYLKDLPKERINLEFSKLIISENAAFTLTLMKKYSLLDFLLKGLQKISKEDFKKLKTLPKDYLLRMSFLYILSKIKIDEIQIKFKISKKNLNNIKRICQNKKVIKTEIEAMKLKYFFGKEISKKNYLLISCIFNKELNSNIIKILDNWMPPKFPISGHDLMKFDEIKKDAFKDVLEYLQKWWINKNFSPKKKQCLDKLKKHIISMKP